jgi:wyosine [tRNA(Phe)-imidazoG37] synthetase (radical SAM superfamily)
LERVLKRGTGLKDSPFQRHGRNYDDYKYCYPVLSRRSRGVSIGINLSRRKECNFDCPYCQIDRTEVSASNQWIETDVLKQELIRLIEDTLSGVLFTHPRFEGTPETHKILRDLSLSGDGEPTTSKYFEEIARIVLDLISLYKNQGINIQPIVITNGTMLHKEKIQRILQEMFSFGGGPWVKLDASTDEEFKSVAESKIPYETLLESLLSYSRKTPTTLQMIHYGWEDGTESFQPENMIQRLKDLKSKGALLSNIQLYTLSRSTKVKNLIPTSSERLELVGNQLHKATGIDVGVYP